MMQAMVGQGGMMGPHTRDVLRQLAPQPFRLIADDDIVVALTDVAVAGETGQSADVFTLRDGKTVHVLRHNDTSLLERVYGKKSSPPG